MSIINAKYVFSIKTGSGHTGDILSNQNTRYRHPIYFLLILLTKHFREKNMTHLYIQVTTTTDPGDPLTSVLDHYVTTKPVQRYSFSSVINSSY